MAIKGIFFDAADVFYERDEPTASFVRQLLTERGYSSQLSAEELACQQVLNHQANGGLVSPGTYWNEVLKMHGVDAPQERALMIEKIMSHANNIHAIPGGRETLAALKQRGFLLGIITDTIYPLEWKMGWLEQVGVAELFDVVACSSTLGVHKPDPAIYLLAARMLDLEPARCVVIEDAPVGVQAAKAAGAVCIAVTNSVGPEQLAGADLVVSSLAEVSLDRARGLISAPR